MADEPKPSTSTDDAFWLLGVLAILVILWYFAGGPGKADLRGLFISPLEPLGTGEAYGPQFGGDSATTPTFESAPTFGTSTQ